MAYDRDDLPDDIPSLKFAEDKLEAARAALVRRPLEGDPEALRAEVRYWEEIVGKMRWNAAGSIADRRRP